MTLRGRPIIRLRLKEDWFGPLIFIYGLGWLPPAIVAQCIFAPGGWSSPSDSAPMLIVVAIWFGPAVLAVIAVGLAFLVSLGLPFERVHQVENVPALEARIAELERELQIGGSEAAE
jgi:hypothetical protein